jgi:hypothetical protein
MKKYNIHDKAFFIARQKSSFGAVCTGPRPARLFHSEFGVPLWGQSTCPGKLFGPVNMHSSTHRDGIDMHGRVKEHLYLDFSPATVNKIERGLETTI